MQQIILAVLPGSQFGAVIRLILLKVIKSGKCLAEILVGLPNVVLQARTVLGTAIVFRLLVAILVRVTVSWEDVARVRSRFGLIILITSGDVAN